MDDAKETWDHKADTWIKQADDPQNKYTWLIQCVAKLVLRHRQAGSTLDIGCGPGLLCGLLAEAGFDAYGADISEKMLQAVLGAAFPVRRAVCPAKPAREKAAA